MQIIVTEYGVNSTVVINRRFDVPFLAGASNDGKTVYIDRRVPRKLAVRRKNGKSYLSIEPDRFLATHETVEHRLMVHQKMPYLKAHAIATHAEKAAVERADIDWKSYEAVMDGLLAHIEHEKPRQAPPDLYTKPYPHDKAELLKKLAVRSRAEGGPLEADPQDANPWESVPRDASGRPIIYIGGGKPDPNQTAPGSSPIPGPLEVPAAIDKNPQLAQPPSPSGPGGPQNLQPDQSVPPPVPPSPVNAQGSAPAGPPSSDAGTANAALPSPTQPHKPTPDELAAWERGEPQPPTAEPVEHTRSILDKLLGLGGPRYQLFPERIIRSALSAPGEVYATGQLTQRDPYGRVTGVEPEISAGPTSTDILPEQYGIPGTNITWSGFGVFNEGPSGTPAGFPSDTAIQRAQDVAAMQFSGGAGAAEEGAVGAAGGKPPPGWGVIEGGAAAPRANTNVIAQWAGKTPEQWLQTPAQERMFIQAEYNAATRAHYNTASDYDAAATNMRTDFQRDFPNATPRDFGDFLVSPQGQRAYDHYMQQAKDDPALLTEAGKPGAALAAAERSPFYSAVEQTISKAPQNKMTADQWAGWLKNQPGIKAEELEWSGLGDLPKGPITMKGAGSPLGIRSPQARQLFDRTIGPFAGEKEFANKYLMGAADPETTMIEPSEYFDGAGISITSSLVGPDHNHIGSIERHIVPGEAAYHSVLEINPKAPSGFTKQLLQNQIDLYNKMGVRYVDLFANISVGGYAWAKYGWVPDAQSWDSVRQGQFGIPGRLKKIWNAIDQNPEIGKQIPPQVMRAIPKIAANPDPRSIWDLADINAPVPRELVKGSPRGDQYSTYTHPSTKTIGQYLLKGMGWDGRLNLFDPESMDRFNGYIGRGGALQSGAKP